MTETETKDKMLILDMGSRSKKQIKRLRKGKGRLMENLQDTLDALRSEGQLSSENPVVIVVKEKRKSKGLRLF
ncbi:MAG: hypothetical protein V9G20_18485 [Candidatus Promineifilaceae bacterium]|jgi:hypothetical protein